MSYYLLPKKNTVIEILPISSSDTILKPYISQSVEYYLYQMSEQIKSIERDTNCSYTSDFIQKAINPYEYIFTKVPGTKISVSKIKPDSTEFYNFLEILYTLHLFSDFSHKKINTFVQGQNSKSIIDGIDILRENHNDNHIMCDNYDFKHSIDFMYFELEKSDPIQFMIMSLKYILEFQSKNGISIIKLNSIVHKPILDILFLLTSLYEKVYIIKPNVSNFFDGERYIVARNFTLSIENMYYYLIEMNSLIARLQEQPDQTYVSIVKQELPYYFLNKVEDANIIIGHQQLEGMEQMINIFKNKNKEDRIETLKKNNIQKCVQWCEKYNIPYNKFTEKVNIFLNSTLETESNQFLMGDAESIFL